MKLSLFVLGSLSLGVQEVTGYYFNLGGFLEPILNPKLDTFGQARYHSKHSGFEQVARFDER